MERWWEPPPEPRDAPTGAHLFVCQHGLWGSPEDVSFLEQYLRHNGWLTLNARSNSARCTFDGADVCGDRLAAEVVSHVQRLEAAGVTVTRISFAAYSFGGLIARYAVGKLLASGFFSGVAPVNFLTIATPHLGCWEHPNSMSQLAYNSILPWTLSRTGRQLLLADRWLEPEGLPLLAAMARPDCTFHAALAAFSKRVLLADIRSDRTVPYTTAAITAVNPYLPPGAAAAPYAMPSRSPRLSRAQGYGCGYGCGCECSSAPLEEGEEEEASDAAAAASGGFADLGLGDGDGDGDGGGVGAGATTFLRGCSDLLGLGSVLSFGLGITSLLFRGATGGSSRAADGAGEGRRRRRTCGGGNVGRPWVDAVGCGTTAAGGGCRCGCSCCAATSASAPAAAMIPLPISSSYPCIVSPHPAPRPTLSASAAVTAAAAAGLSGSFRSRPPPVAPSAALHRSASSPLPKLLYASSGTGGSGGGGGLARSTPHVPIPGSSVATATAAAKLAAAPTAAAAAAAGWAAPPNGTRRLPRYGSDATVSIAGAGSHKAGDEAAFVGFRRHNSQGSAAAGYGSTVPARPQQPQRPYLYGSAPASRLTSAVSARQSSGSSVPAIPSFPRGGGRVASGCARSSPGYSPNNSGVGTRSSSEDDDALASRVRLGLFVALLPVLLSLWLCMVAWLAAIWIHHYAVLLTVRPDRTWDVRVVRQPPAAMEAGGDGGNGGGDSAGAGATVQADINSVRYEYDGEHGTSSVELLVRLTDAAPPPSALRRQYTQQHCQLGLPCTSATPAGPPPASLPAAAAAASPAITGVSRSDYLGTCIAVPHDGDRPPPSLATPPGRSLDPAVPPEAVRSSPCATAAPHSADVAASPADVTAGSLTSEAAAGTSTADVSPPWVVVDAAIVPCVTRGQNQCPGGGGENVPSEGDGVGAATASRAAAADAAAIGAADVPTETATIVSSMVRSIFAPLAREHHQDDDDGGGRPGVIPSRSNWKQVELEAEDGPRALPAAAELQNHSESNIEARHHYVRALTRSIFRSVVQRHACMRASAGEEAEEAPGVGTREGRADGRTTAAARRHLGTAAAAGVAGSSGDGDAGCTSVAADRQPAESQLRPRATGAHERGPEGHPPCPSSLLGTGEQHQEHEAQQQHEEEKEQKEHSGDGDGSEAGEAPASTAPRGSAPEQPGSGGAGPSVAARAVVPVNQKDGAGVSLPVRETRPPPLAEDLREGNAAHGATTAPDDPMRSGAGARPPPVASPPGKNDPAALLSEMIANLNQLEWQKVDVDTRHYHAHAAIVIRSSRRFRSHMHIVDYAVRQLRL